LIGKRMPDDREPLLTIEAKATTPAPKVTGGRGALLRLLLSLSSLLSMRLDLARLELQEAQHNIQKRILWLLLALTFVGMALLAANVLLILNYWDTPQRDTVLYSMIGGYFALGLFAFWRLTAASRQTKNLFSSTIAEFEKDKAWLKSAARKIEPQSESDAKE
jgi:uncharacterized membrane protein YqjE